MSHVLIAVVAAALLSGCVDGAETTVTPNEVERLEAIEAQLAEVEAAHGALADELRDLKGLLAEANTENDRLGQALEDTVEQLERTEARLAECRRGVTPGAGLNDTERTVLAALEATEGVVDVGGEPSHSGQVASLVFQLDGIEYWIYAVPRAIGLGDLSALGNETDLATVNGIEISVYGPRPPVDLVAIFEVGGLSVRVDTSEGTSSELIETSGKIALALIEVTEQ